LRKARIAGPPSPLEEALIRHKPHNAGIRSQTCARDGRDDPSGGIDFSNPIFTASRKIQIARGVHGHAGRLIELRKNCSSPVRPSRR
jgi:hypothetical protein